MGEGGESSWSSVKVKSESSRAEAKSVNKAVSKSASETASGSAVEPQAGRSVGHTNRGDDKVVDKPATEADEPVAEPFRLPHLLSVQKKRGRIFNP